MDITNIIKKVREARIDSFNLPDEAIRWQVKRIKESLAKIKHWDSIVIIFVEASFVCTLNKVRGSFQLTSRFARVSYPRQNIEVSFDYNGDPEDFVAVREEAVVDILEGTPSEILKELEEGNDE